MKWTRSAGLAPRGPCATSVASPTNRCGARFRRHRPPRQTRATNCGWSSTIRVFTLARRASPITCCCPRHPGAAVDRRPGDLSRHPPAGVYPAARLKRPEIACATTSAARAGVIDTWPAGARRAAPRGRARCLRRDAKIAALGIRVRRGCTSTPGFTRDGPEPFTASPLRLRRARSDSVVECGGPASLDTAAPRCSRPSPRSSLARLKRLENGFARPEIMTHLRQCPPARRPSPCRLRRRWSRG